MGQKLKIWATMTSLILLSGILGFGSSAYAVDLPSQGQPAQAQNGCDKSDPRSGGNASRNPQCVGIESPCDTNDDGTIDVGELLAVPATNTQVLDALADADLDGSISINTAEELAILITFPPFEGC